MTIYEFKRKYGAGGASLVIRRLVSDLAADWGKEAQATLVEELANDLQSALESLPEEESYNA
jgi:hypothetical protein